jgi:carbonic anhydrase/acetyltransferase-like protein (isoleucine patch superfamily)
LISWLTITKGITSRGESIMKFVDKFVIGSSLAILVSQVINKAIFGKENRDEVSSNVQTTFNLELDNPNIHYTAFVHPKACVIGQVSLGKDVFVGPFSSIRGDEGLRIHIGDHSNVQDGVILHGLKNFDQGKMLHKNAVTVKNQIYSIYIDERVSVTHQAHIHGPARVDSDVFIGMQSLVFDSYIQEGAVLEPGCKVIGVMIPKNRYVPAGQVITSQLEADKLPEITPEYVYSGMNQKVTEVNIELAKGYQKEYQEWN